MVGKVLGLSLAWAREKFIIFLIKVKYRLLFGYDTNLMVIGDEYTGVSCLVK